MRRRFAVVLSALLGFAPLPAAAASAADIRAACAAGPRAFPASELGNRLEAVQNDFPTVQARVADPAGYMEALDRVIAASDYAYLLDCRGAAPYSVVFNDVAAGEGTMSVHPKVSSAGALTGVEMRFDLVKNVQRGLIVYIHELTHVCQAPELARRMGRRDEGAVSRWHVFGEIEAYARMAEAFAALVRHSARLCREEGRANPGDLGEVYGEMMDTLAAGTHAQMNVAAMFESRPEELAHWFDLTQPKVRYVDRLGDPFELHRLHPELRALVEGAGIPLRE